MNIPHTRKQPQSCPSGTTTGSAFFDSARAKDGTSVLVLSKSPDGGFGFVQATRTP